MRYGASETRREDRMPGVCYCVTDPYCPPAIARGLRICVYGSPLKVIRKSQERIDSAGVNAGSMCAEIFVEEI